MYDMYCSHIGRSKPNDLRKFSTSSEVARGLQLHLQDPGIMCKRKKVIFATPNKISTPMISFDKIYFFNFYKPFLFIVLLKSVI